MSIYVELSFDASDPVCQLWLMRPMVGVGEGSGI